MSDVGLATKEGIVGLAGGKVVGSERKKERHQVNTPGVLDKGTLYRH